MTRDPHAAGFPHGTPEGFAEGCRTAQCPALLPCRDVNIRYSGDYAFRKRFAAGMSLAEILSLDADDAAAGAAAIAQARAAAKALAREGLHRQVVRRTPRRESVTAETREAARVDRAELTATKRAERAAERQALREQAAAATAELRAATQVRIAADKAQQRLQREAAKTQRAAERVAERAAQRVERAAMTAAQRANAAASRAEARAAAALTAKTERAASTSAQRAAAALQRKAELEAARETKRAERAAERDRTASSQPSSVRTPKPIEHGTNAGFARGCPCTPCYEAHRAYYQEYMASRRAEAVPAAVHGTAYGYQLGCHKRDECPAENSCADASLGEERRRRRESGVPERDLVPAAPVREHLVELHRTMPYTRIGLLAGIAPKSVMRLVVGRDSGPRKGQLSMQTDRATAERILAIEVHS